MKCSYGYRKTDNPAETSLMTAMTQIASNQLAPSSVFLYKIVSKLKMPNYYNNMYY